MGFFVSLFWDLGGALALFAIAWVVSFWWLHDIWSNETDREWWAEGLEFNAGRTRYRRNVQWVLNGFSTFLGRREIRFRGLDESDAAYADRIMVQNQRPWSWGLLDFALLLALAYPVTFLLFQWTFTGGEGRLGTLPILTADVPWYERAALIGSIAGVIICWRLGGQTKTRWRWAWFGAAIGFFAVAFATALAVALAVSVAVSVAIAITVAGKFALALAVALAGAGAVAGVTAFAGVVSVVVAVAVAVAVAGDLARERLERKSRHSLHLLLGWVILLYAVLVAVTIWQQPTQERTAEEIAGLLLFLGFLPLINAVADFFSTGLTRWLLGRGAKGWTWGFAALDLILGFATFLMLGGMVVLTFALLAWLGAPPLLDLGLLLAGPQPSALGGMRPAPEGSILGSPGEYWWLYVTFLSTLLPTVIHACVATFSLIAMWPEKLRLWIAHGLRAGTPTAGKLRTLILSVLMAASVALPLMLIWWAGAFLFTHFPGLGEGLVGGFRWFALWTGAIPAP